MRIAWRGVNVVCTLLILAVCTHVLVSLLFPDRTDHLPQSARPGRVVVVGQGDSFELEELDISLRSASGQRLTLFSGELTRWPAVLDEPLRADVDRAADLVLRFAWSGSPGGQAEITVLAVEHPSMLRATGLYLSFTDEGMLVRTGGKQAHYRLRAGRWERMDGT